MATARISKDGDRVILKLSFRDAAALEAVLSRIGDDTNPEVNLATLGTWAAMRDIRDEVCRKHDWLWPKDFDGFRESTYDLEDPDKSTEADD